MSSTRMWTTWSSFFGLDLVDEANDAVFTDADGDELADGPVIVRSARGFAGNGGNDGAVAIALDDIAFRAVALELTCRGGRVGCRRSADVDPCGLVRNVCAHCACHANPRPLPMCPVVDNSAGGLRPGSGGW